MGCVRPDAGKLPLRCLDFAADHIEVIVVFARERVRYSASLRHRVAGEKTILAMPRCRKNAILLYNVFGVYFVNSVSIFLRNRARRLLS